MGSMGAIANIRVQTHAPAYIPTDVITPPLYFDGPASARKTFAFAHGAGVGMDSEFMNDVAAQLGNAGIRVARFEFPYMQKTRADGKRRPPDRAPVLLETGGGAVIDALGRENLTIGGKSMGGRMASMRAVHQENAGTPVAGCICLGYPFHAPGKPEKVRADHLADTKTPCLILQGDRDPSGTRAEINGYRLSAAIDVHFLEDGEHSFIPRKSSGRTQAENWETAVEEMIRFISSID